MSFSDKLRGKKCSESPSAEMRMQAPIEAVKNKRRAYANTIFIVACLAILIFLFNAPKETTVKLPDNTQHAPFKKMKNKKEAERYCGDCHSPNGQYPLSDKHPPQYRCLFCHKTQ
jgi:hypothetical protein